MPVVTFNWSAQYLAQDTTPYSVSLPGAGTVVANWAVVVQWRLGGPGGGLLPNTRGLYLIETGGTPLYAGKAINMRNRFEGRSDALYDYQIRAANLAHLSVRRTSVGPAGLDVAERWLVRYLFLYDHQGGGYAPRLVNVMLTQPYVAPPGGLTIVFTNWGPASPAYLHDPASPFYTLLGPASFQYVYPAGTPM